MKSLSIRKGFSFVGEDKKKSHCWTGKWYGFICSISLFGISVEYKNSKCNKILYTFKFPKL